MLVINQNCGKLKTNIKKDINLSNFPSKQQKYFASAMKSKRS